MHSWAAEWVPPRVLRVLRRASRNSGVSYEGDFETWGAARSHSRGYDSDFILERVKQAQLKVRDGSVAFERDSVVFDRVEHSFPALAALGRAAAIHSGKLSVVDVGGSLGSSYSQCRSFFESLQSLSWSVIEQPNFVECGKQHFENSELQFYVDLESCLAAQQPNVVLLSSVLPYVERPYELLDAVISARIPHCIIDRTPLIGGHSTRLTVQHVPAAIYGQPASYPAWILNHDELLEHLASAYRLILEFDAIGGAVDLSRAFAVHTGFVLDLIANDSADNGFAPK